MPGKDKSRTRELKAWNKAIWRINGAFTQLRQAHDNLEPEDGKEIREICGRLEVLLAKGLRRVKDLERKRDKAA